MSYELVVQSEAVIEMQKAFEWYENDKALSLPDYF
jgi:hypothetical protein